MRKIVSIVLILILAGFPLLAQEVYEGLAVRGRSGEFPAEGFFAASSSFARNTLVELRNPSTGERIEVIIVSRVSEPGIFMILSDEAAEALDVTGTSALSLVASPVSVPGLTSVDANRDLPFSTDPEVNPRAAFSDPNEFVFNPGSEIPEIDNPLLRPDRVSRRDEPVEDEPASGPAAPVEENRSSEVLSDEPRDISSEEAFIIVEEFDTPPLADLFPEEPVEEDDEEVSDTQTPEATLSEVPQAPMPDQSLQSENEPLDPVREVETLSDERPDVALPEDIPQNVEGPEMSRGTLRGLSSGLGQILDDGIRSETPVTGSRAVRIPETVPVYRLGILSALSRIQDGTMAVSPAFDLSAPEYSFWPEEYDADRVEDPADADGDEPGDEAEVADLTNEADGEPETSLSPLDPTEESIRFGLDIEPDVPAEEPVEELVEELVEDDPALAVLPDTADDIALGDDMPADETDNDGFARPLDEDPAQSWINRIRELYPDRQLFLPPAGTDLDVPLPRLTGEETRPPSVTLSEAANPVESAGTPEISLGVRRAAAETLPGDRVPEIGFDFEDELPSVDLGFAPRPARDRAIASGDLPLPEADVVDEIENSSIRTAAPADAAPRVDRIPLAQYLDPRPAPGIGRINAEDSVLSGLAGPPEPRLAAEASIETPLPRAEQGDAARPEISHEPREKVFGIEAGILRLGAEAPEVSAGDPPVPGEVAFESADGGITRPMPGEERTEIDVALSEPGVDEETAVEETAEVSEELTVEAPIDGGRPEDVIVTLEEAEFRSPELREPEDGITRPMPGEEDTDFDLALTEPGVEEPQPLDEPDPVEFEEPADLAIQEPEEESPEELTEEPAEERIDSGDLLVFLEESAERPPAEDEQDELAVEPLVETVETPVTVSPRVTSEIPDIRWATENLPLVYTLQPDGYYLQVGAYANPRSAKRVVEEVAPGYPLAVLPVGAAENPLYRVFVGPLTEDEQGTVLFWFRAKGYRDAFIRKGL